MTRARSLLVSMLCVSAWTQRAAAEDDPDDIDDAKQAPLDAADKLDRVATRKGVTVPVVIREAAKPTAVVLLYAGGGGRLGLTDKGFAKGADNFMVRTRGELAKAGLIAVVVDAPSDHDESLRAYRISADSGADSAQLVAWASAKWKLPVWFVGTSRGTLSVANAAARGAGAHGIVLTSTVTAGRHEKMGDVDVGKIGGQVLLVHHQKDGCNASPIAGAKALAKQLHASWIEIHGGETEKHVSKCSPESHHGYLGQDAEVVGEIAKFVAAH
jgi:hypothetical protein